MSVIQFLETRKLVSLLNVGYRIMATNGNRRHPADSAFTKDIVINFLYCLLTGILSALLAFNLPAVFRTSGFLARACWFALASLVAQAII